MNQLFLSTKTFSIGSLRIFGRNTLITIFSISLLFLGCFAGLQPCIALSSDDVADEPSEMINPSEKLQTQFEQETELSKDEAPTNNYPDLGDDQVFPFAAGLDSY